MKARMTSIALLLAACCAAGCDSAAHAEGSPSDTTDAGQQNDGCRTDHTVTKDERMPFIPQDDVDLIDALVPHHRGAVEMAEIEISQGNHPEVTAMAEHMRSAQLREIEELMTLREGLTGCAEVPPLSDAHMEADLEVLRSASGEQLDRLFLEHMIPHHAGALQFTHAALPNLRNGDLREMAEMIIEAQSAEISEMHELEMRLE